MTRTQCPHCGVWTANAGHVCVEYDGPPCEVCGQPTVFVLIGAPGYGQGRTCASNHYVGTRGELTIDDVR